MKKILVLLLMAMLFNGCSKDDSDTRQRKDQERLLKEGTAQTGIPAIKNFRERKMLKEILELRDQTGLITYTYLWNELNGRKVFFCTSIGYGIPYATQYTNPQKVESYANSIILSQADPNGLFSPASAEGTWVLCKEPDRDKVTPVYIEPRIIVQQWKD